MDQIYAYHKGNWYRLARKKINRHTVLGSVCQTTTVLREDKKCVYWKGFRQECCVSPILFTSYSEYLTMEAVEGVGDCKTGQVIRAMKYADNLVLLSDEEAVLQGMTKILIDAGICYGMEMNLEKNEGNENFKANISSTE